MRPLLTQFTLSLKFFFVNLVLMAI